MNGTARALPESCPDIQSLITVSIVSHAHAPTMLAALLSALAPCPAVTRVVLTYNLPQPAVPVPPALAERVVVRHNPAPRGFAANHNAAFVECQTPFFCVLNPDVTWTRDPFPALLAAAFRHDAALVAPAVVAPDGRVEDSARHFPTLRSLWAKALGGADGRYAYAPGEAPRPVDWVAGMFHLFRRDAFAAVGGYDEGYHLYYEDVDLCARLWQRGEAVWLVPQAVVTHAAQRTSRRRLRYTLWHAQSMARYLWRYRGSVSARSPTGAEQ